MNACAQFLRDQRRRDGWYRACWMLIWSMWAMLIAMVMLEVWR